MECGLRLPLDLLEQLPQEASGGERRVVSVLFADLSGFTSYSEGVDVEDVRSIARETADRLGEIVVRYGGTVDKIIGDCVMAVWGAPSSHEDDPERAVRAALAMQAYTTDNSERFAGLPLSIGINTGEAIWTVVGDQHTVLGDIVNTAARLQGAANRGEVVVGQATFEATERSIEYETLEPIVAKNKREPVPAFKALKVKGVARRRRSTSLPIVGREDERARLWELWDLVRTERSPYSALMFGAAGIGKSRLIQAVIDDVGEEAMVIRGSCLAYGEGITYWPVIEMIREAAGIHHDDDHDAVSQKLGALLEGLGSEDYDELRTMAVALANLVGEPRTPRGTWTATEISKGELHWGLRRILELASLQRPLVLIIEDLHWAEPALLELVLYIVAPRPDVPILGFGTARPEMIEQHPDFILRRPNQRVLEIEALPVEAASDMVRRLAGDGDLPEESVQRLLQAAGGNPLFLEEMIQMWLDAGGQSDLLERIDVPSGLQSLISSRLDGVGAKGLRVLTHASVLGNVFWSGALEALQVANGELQRVIESLEERDFIRSQPSSSITGQREFAFKHSLIRDVAYSRMPKSERAVLHERAGNWVGGLGKDEYAEIIAYHLEEACKLASELSRSGHKPPVLAAVRALTRAAEKSEGHEGFREAGRYYDRAVGLLGSGYPETSIQLRFDRARMSTLLGRIEPAHAEFSEVVRQAREFGRPDLGARALLEVVDAEIALGRIADARVHLGEAEDTVAQASEPDYAIRLAFIRGLVKGSVDGSVNEAERELRGASELAEELGNQAMRIMAELRLGMLTYNVGRLAEAASSFESVRRLAAERGSLKEQAIATCFLAAAKLHLGPREEAEQLAGRALAWLERLAAPLLTCQALEILAKLAIARGNFGAAQGHLVRAVEVAPEHRLVRAGLDRFLAEARARQGHAVGARAAASSANELASEDHPYAGAFAAVAAGCAAAAEGSANAAYGAFERGLKLFAEQSLTTELAEARVTYAWALERLGDHLAAAEQLALAGQIFAEMGATASVAHVNQLIADLDEQCLLVEDATGALS